MILKLKEWCEGIVIAIIISTIIEMIVPDNKSKKYVKVVIGIYIMFVSLNPILELLKYDLKFENIFNVNTVQTSQSIDTNIKDVYVLGIEEKIKEDIESMGYILESVQVLVDSNYEEINEINLKIKGKKNFENIVEIEKINIGKQTDKNEDYEDIVNFLVTNYLVTRNKIFIEV